ncbi:hypothetical protein [Streptomyces sp. NPDC020983]|uniref:hypothetical protein n=1 Tax=Streptomyces sp. NPDC020983 TaxID=3365106 RepID=UPI0037AA7545
MAIHIAASLDYQGKPPTRKQRQLIEDRLVVWLEAGWSMDGLAVILDIAGQGVRHAPTVYALRLDPEQMPAPESAVPATARGGVRGPVPSAAELDALTAEQFFGGQPAGAATTWGEASSRAARRMAAGAALEGTDDRVAGWRAVGAQLAAREAHRPYRNPQDDSVYDEPWTYSTPPKPPWCGNPECNETDRMRDGLDASGLPFVYECPDCHPNRAQAA